MVAVAVAVRPGDFRGGEAAPDGSAWELFGERHERNPRLGVPDWAWAMVQIWRQCRPMPALIRGMAAGAIPVVGPLPGSGGAGDQAAVMLDALDLMDEAAARMRA